MNLTAFALVAASAGLGQAEPPADARFVAKRSLSIPVEFNPDRMADVDQARLFVSRDGGHTYVLHQQITPKESGFTLTAPEDGTYWVQMQLRFRDGRLEPKDPSGVPPAEKLIVDTTNPVVTIGATEQTGGEIRVDWRIDDKHPSDSTTKVFYKPTTGDNGSWKEVPESAVRGRSARFTPELSGPLLVQVATADLAGNIGAANREVSTRSASGFAPASATAAPTPPAGLPEPSSVSTSTNPPDGPLPAAPLSPSAPPTVTVSSSTGGMVAPPPPHPNEVPVAPSVEGPKPIAVGSGVGATVAGPAAEPRSPALPALHHSRSPRFSLNYSLDGGPSGVARVELYVTRDDGRNWVHWSSHNGRETPLQVILDTRFNKEVEGDYGFVLVPVSGAGLSEPAPRAGTPPDMRVRVDVTSPVIKVYQPTADPTNRNALLLHWEATDRNFGSEPLAIEYSDRPNGPWRPVSGPDVVAAGVATGPTADTREPHRIANTGSFSWQPPLTLAEPKVYLKFTAWDLAGNRSEVVTPNPILVDLTKPKATIQGISVGSGR